MNKETGEVNEIFKLDFLLFFPLLRRLMPDRENYGGNFLHSRRRVAAVERCGVYLFFWFISFYFYFYSTTTTKTAVAVVLTYSSNRDNRNFIVRKDNKGVLASRCAHFHCIYYEMLIMQNVIKQ
jgi:hypothetical protein